MRPAVVPVARAMASDLSAGWIVRTKALEPADCVSSDLAPALVPTGEAGELYERIGDEELVRLAGVPAGVVHIGQEAKLVLLAGTTR